MKSINELFFARPWAIKEELLGPMSDIVVRHLKGEKLTAEQIEAATKKSSLPEGIDYEVIGGVARIPVTGVIAKRSSMVNGISQRQGTSVEQIQKNLEAALADDSVRMIALDVDSPGGSVDGIHELSSAIYESRKKKKIYAYANGQMCSAAYYIGSAAEKIFCTASSEVGSIGVYATVADWTHRNHEEGVTMHVIRAGSEKAAGHPDRPFTEDDRRLVQEEVNSYYELFIESVARNRGISTEDAKKIGTGRVWIGKKALEVGLVDGVEMIESVFSGKSGGRPAAAASPVEGAVKAADESGVSGEEKQTEVIAMANEKKTADQLRIEHPEAVEAVAKEAKSAGVVEGQTAGKAEGKAEGEKMERARCVGILKKLEVKEYSGYSAIAHASVEAGDSIEVCEGKMKDQRIKDLTAKAPVSPGPGEGDTNADSQDHVARAKKYQAENGGPEKCSITKALQATAEKREKKS